MAAAKGNTPKIPKEVNDAFQRAMNDEEIPIETFLKIATWVYRELPSDFRCKALVGLVCYIGDAWIAQGDEPALQPESTLH